MGWFTRKTRSDVDETPTAGEIEILDDVPTRPTSSPLGAAEQARIGAAVAWFGEAGVDLLDADSLGRAFDTALGHTPDDEIIERFGVGVGEHLRHHTDFIWALVTDIYGTDLGLMGRYDDTVVVPHTLVGARVLNRERGWIPGVTAHLTRIRRR
ncbi:MAG TPA: DUF3806 domain-containing protein [Dermatophilaceae bacterium]|nr:DUF3806 domain-containing protein [Dermatophilaceae bacterium]